MKTTTQGVDYSARIQYVDGMPVIVGTSKDALASMDALSEGLRKGLYGEKSRVVQAVDTLLRSTSLS